MHWPGQRTKSHFGAFHYSVTAVSSGAPRSIRNDRGESTETRSPAPRTSPLGKGVSQWSLNLLIPVSSQGDAQRNSKQDILPFSPGVTVGNTTQLQKSFLY
ncbi:hypothetical protein SKAU_G00188080 [Synaphobranchus kaupii]|uniref:Uncharacterized protein n=1 Tax=Synaphobranchus kaupii TaxID=118154 RepID=A0A9Q1FD49_SYNKA|nr:hypothetical protein SKAU_G00188080 [Synaphobranchus kaupii]